MSIEFVAQEFWDYVNESAIPVAIKIVENNYLFVQIADYAAIEATVTTVDTELITTTYSYEELYALYLARQRMRPDEARDFIQQLLDNATTFTSWPNDSLFTDYWMITAVEIVSDTTVGSTRTIVINSSGEEDGDPYTLVQTYTITPTLVTLAEVYTFEIQGVITITAIISCESSSVREEVDEFDETLLYITATHVTQLSEQSNEEAPIITTYGSTDTVVPWLYFIAAGYSSEPTVDTINSGQLVPNGYTYYPTVYNPLLNTSIPQFTDPFNNWWNSASGNVDLVLNAAGSSSLSIGMQTAGTRSVVFSDINITQTTHSTTPTWQRALTDNDPYIGVALSENNIAAIDLLSFETHKYNFFTYQDVVWSHDVAYVQDLMTELKLRLAGIGYAISTGEGSTTAPDTFCVDTTQSGNGQILWTAGDAIGTSTISNILTVCVPVDFYPDEYGMEQDVVYAIRSIRRAKKYTIKRKSQVLSAQYRGGFLGWSGGGSAAVSMPGSSMAAIKAALELQFFNFYGQTITDLLAITSEETVNGSYVYYKNGAVTMATLYLQDSPLFFGTQYGQVDATFSIQYWLTEETVYLDKCDAKLVCGYGIADYLVWNSTTQVFDVSDTVPASLTDLALDDLCLLDDDETPRGGMVFRHPINGGFSLGDGSATFGTTEYTSDTITPDFPSATFNLQSGIPVPVYPTYQGAFIYDLELQKWGKMKMSFLSLLDFAPVNTQSSQLLPNARYGVAGGILDADGKIFQWDANPTDAYIKYGKFSLFRLGVTTIQEIIAQFGIQSTGTVETETSLDGKTIDLSLSTSYDIEGARVAKVPVQRTGVWHNIILRGQFDLTYLQVNAYRSGRR